MPRESSRYQLSNVEKSQHEELSVSNTKRKNWKYSRCPHVNNAKDQKGVVVGFHGGSRTKQKGDYTERKPARGEVDG